MMLHMYVSNQLSGVFIKRELLPLCAAMCHLESFSSFFVSRVSHIACVELIGWLLAWLKAEWMSMVVG